MTARCGMAIATSAVAVVVGASVVASTGAETADTAWRRRLRIRLRHRVLPPGCARVVWWRIVQKGSGHSPGGLSHVFGLRKNLVVGPLAMVGAGQPFYSDSFGGNKFPLYVKAGHRVTLELSLRTRRQGAGLAYCLLLPGTGELHVRDTH